MTTSSKPLVSVICLCYNHADFVEETLNSVDSQTYRNIELIIVDDFSKDDSRALIEKWVNNHLIAKHVIFNKKNLGMTKAFNKGLNMAKGKYIIDLAADDVLLPTSIQNHINNFKKNQFRTGISFGNAESIDRFNKHIEYRYPVDQHKKVINHPGEGNLYTKIVEQFFISSPSLMSDIEVYNTLGGYDANLYFEDLDFLIRSSRVFPYFFCDEIVIKRRELSNSMSADIERRNRGSYLHRKSFFKIFIKTNKLSETKTENWALIKRVSQEIKNCFKLKYPDFFFKNGILLTFLFLKHLFLKKN